METPYLCLEGKVKPQGTLIGCGLEMVEEAKAIHNGMDTS
jgi:hypothetical protein